MCIIHTYVYTYILIYVFVCFCIYLYLSLSLYLFLSGYSEFSSWNMPDVFILLASTSCIIPISNGHVEYQLILSNSVQVFSFVKSFLLSPMQLIFSSVYPLIPVNTSVTLHRLFLNILFSLYKAIDKQKSEAMKYSLLYPVSIYNSAQLMTKQIFVKYCFLT